MTTTNENQIAWPKLPTPDEWLDTYTTVHMWDLIVVNLIGIVPADQPLLGAHALCIGAWSNNNADSLRRRHVHHRV